MIGMLAFSKAGHDKQNIYMIIGEDAEYVYLCDGITRTLDKPKKKNKKHIQPIKKGYDNAVGDKLLHKQMVYDEEIKRVIKIFNAQGGRNV